MQPKIDQAMPRLHQSFLGHASTEKNQSRSTRNESGPHRHDRIIAPRPPGSRLIRREQRLGELHMAATACAYAPSWRIL
jgi:hypothetical protein